LRLAHPSKPGGLKCFRPWLVRVSQRTRAEVLKNLVCDRTAGSSREARVPDGFALEAGSGANRTKKAVGHARERRVAKVAGASVGQPLASARSHAQMSAPAPSRPLPLLLLWGLVLLLSFKNAYLQRQVAGDAHFYCPFRVPPGSSTLALMVISKARIETASGRTSGHSSR
jgi:hypothetical protein